MINEVNCTSKNRIFDRVIDTIILISLIFTIALSPLIRGLFFSGELYFFENITLLTYILFWINKIIKKDKKMAFNKVDIAMLCFIAAYIISSIFSINHRLALYELSKYFMYFALFNMVSEYALRKRYQRLFTIILISSGVLVSILGFDGAAGGYIAGFFNQVFEITNIPVSFYSLTKWNRLQSTFQYPNALAGYVIGLFYLSLGLSLVAKKKKEKVIYSLVSYLLFATLVYTYSRSALIMFAASALIMILIMPKGKKIKSLLYFFAPIISNLIISLQLSKLMQDNNTGLYIWLFLLAGMIINVVLVVISGKIENISLKVSKKAYAIFFGILGAGLLATVIFVFNFKGPLIIDRTKDVEDKTVTYTKSVSLEKGRSYKLLIDDEVNSTDKPNAYTLSIVSKTEDDILSDKSGTQIGYYVAVTEEVNTQGEVYFEVPEDNKIVQLVIKSSYAGTTAKINNLNIADDWTGKVIKKIVLDYRMIPQRIEERFDNFAGNKDLLQRFTYYKDGFEMYKDYWFFGAGGGAWPLLYGEYQNYYYTSTEVHSYLLQIAIESGIFGIGAVIFLLVSIFLVYLKFRKSHKKNTNMILLSCVLVGIIGMFMHSVIDFDFTYPAIYMTFTVLIALLNTICKNYTLKQGHEEDKKANISMKNIGIIKINPIIGLVVSLIMIILPFTFAAGVIADSIYSKYSDTDTHKAENILRIAKNIDFTNSIIKCNYVNMRIINDIADNNNISVATLKDINKQMLKIEKASKNDPDILPIISLLNFKIGDFEKATYYAQRIVQKRPFYEASWQSEVHTFYEIMMYLLSTDDQINQAIQYADAIAKISNLAQNVNKDSIIPVKFNNSTIEMIEIAKYVLDYKYEDIYVIPEKIALYNYPAIDTNGDNSPDTWTVENSSEDIRILYNDDKMLVRNYSNENETFAIKSRELKLNADKKYKIELIASDKKADSINYSISGLTSGVLNYSAGIYTAEFTTPADFKNENNSLILNLQGDWDISKILILEQ